MLRSIKLHHLILVDEATIPFEKGFNVITGETGAGKSALLTALSLVLGGRSDQKVIREGASKAVVEAVFDIDIDLNQYGIDVDDELIVRREVHSNGKSYLFINNTQVSLKVMQELAPALVTITGQHATHALFSMDTHRKMVDLYGKIDLKSFSQVFSEKQRVTKELLHIRSSEAERLRTIDRLKVEIEEIEAVDMYEGEEKELYAEYCSLNSAEESASIGDEVLRKLEVLSTLRSSLESLEKLTEINAALEPSRDLFKEGIMQLEEVDYTVRRELSRQRFSPERLQEVNGRLSLIHRLEKKYGEPLVYLEEARQQLSALTSSEMTEEILQKKLENLEQTCSDAADTLTKRRTSTAKTMRNAFLKHLQPLNLEKADFRIGVEPATMSITGQDQVIFYFRPNVGEKEVPLSECASGGELARVLLALKALLAEKEEATTLIFDEIDANIGGQTATQVGKTLKKIGKEHQVIAITHFAQVAQEGDHHLQIEKQEVDGRTLTTVQCLSSDARQAEFSRMAGVV